jgi:hypothetical protein
MDTTNIKTAAEALSGLYAKGFGGKSSGRYRIAQKLVRDLMGQRRLYPEDVQALTREMLEQGFVLIDMDGFFVVMSTNSFVNYRRANADALAPAG